jgi:hypothetical protein
MVRGVPRALLATSVLALALAGCGLTEPSGHHAPSVEPTGQPIRLTKADAKAAARAMLLRSSDLPGWAKVSIPNQQTPGACRGLDGRQWLKALLAQAQSAFKEQDEGGVVLSYAAIARNESQARRIFASWARIMNGKRGRRCFSGSFKEGVAKAGGSSEGPRLASLGYQVGERSSGFRMAFMVRARDVSIRGYVSLVFFQQGQGLGFFLSSHAFTPFPRDDEVRLARLSAKRMELAQDALRS